MLDQRCRVDGAELLLDNRENWERFQVVLLPACRTIHLSNLRKIKQFYDAGGKVVATTCLPEQSAEFGHDDEVRRLTQEMFGPAGRGVFVPAARRAASDRPSTIWAWSGTSASTMCRRFRASPATGRDPYRQPVGHESRMV